MIEHKNWFLDTKNNAWFICDEQGRRIAKILNQPDRDENAALICSAPGLQRERDEALAKNERLRGAWDAVKNTDWDQPMNEVIDELPSAALTKLKAECQSEALIQIADEFKKAWPDDQRKYFWMVDYAYETRQRAQESAQPCTYPDCRCPLELPHKDSPCAIGRKKDS